MLNSWTNSYFTQSSKTIDFIMNADDTTLSSTVNNISVILCNRSTETVKKMLMWLLYYFSYIPEKEIYILTLKILYKQWKCIKILTSQE